MKRQTRLSLVKIAFICFSVCNVVAPTPLKNLSRLRITKRKFSQVLQNTKQTAMRKCGIIKRLDPLYLLIATNFGIYAHLLYGLSEDFNKVKSSLRSQMSLIDYLLENHPNVIETDRHLEKTYQQFESSTDEK